MALFTRHGIHDPQQPGLDGASFRRHGFTEAPLVLQCYPTLRCPLKCAHCLAAGPQAAARADMPLELFARLCREAAEMGVPELLLTGGEPLAHPEFPALVAGIKANGLSWSLNTAANPDARQRAAMLDHPPAYVAVSVDGPEAVHDAFRGKCGAFADAAAAIRFFAAIPGTTVCAGTTVSTVNLPHLDETFRLVKAGGAHRWGIHLLIPEGRAKTRRDLFPSAPQMRKLLKTVALKRREFPVALCDEMGYAGEWEELVRDEAFFCAAGRAMCAVLPDGSVMPCSTLDPKHREGDLNQTPLADIWRTGFAAQRTPRRAGKCARCKDWAACGSGCWLQRQHGTHCFRHLWKVPGPFRAAAGLALGLGVLAGGGPASAADAPAKAPAVNENLGDFNDAPGTTGNREIDAVLEVKMKSSAINIKGIYGSKANPRRTDAHCFPGATREVLDSMPKALRWLKEHQADDGSWSPTHPLAVSGQALLCFLAHNELKDSKEFGRTVGLAEDYLVKYMNRADAGQDAYAHALAVYALAEDYGMTKNPALKPAMEKGIAVIIAGQRADGGWGLGYGRKDGAWDLRLTVRQIDAIKAGFLAGSDDPQLVKVLKNTLDFLQKTAFKNGAFRRTPDDGETNMQVQASGLLALLLHGQKDSSEAKATLAWIEKNLDAWLETQRVKPGGDGSFAPEEWLCLTRAFVLAGPEHAKKWRPRLEKELLARQAQNGGWDIPSEQAAAARAGRSECAWADYHATTLCCLALEAYYRFLPTFKLNYGEDHTDGAAKITDLL